jgi:ribosomal-protein-alanine N-acetyltransferase
VSGLALRAAGEADLDALAALDAAAFPDPRGRDALAAELTRPFARLDVACRGEAIVGYACAWLIADEVELHRIAVARRREGIGAALLAHVLGTAAAAGGRRALLEVRRGNVAAIGLYQRLGFAVVHTRRGYYADGEDAVVMARELAR